MVFNPCPKCSSKNINFIQKVRATPWTPLDSEFLIYIKCEKCNHNRFHSFTFEDGNTQQYEKLVNQTFEELMDSFYSGEK